MDASRVLFWGVEVTPGKPIPFELNEGEVLHINMATLGETLVDKSGRSVVTARVGEEGEKYALCVLTAGKVESFNLDLTFAGEEKVSLEVSGRNTVHLVGNFGYEGDEDAFSEDEDLINEYSDDESQDADDSDVEPMLLPDDDPPVITEITDDAAPKANGKKDKKPKVSRAKKAGLPNAKDEEDVEDEDDDDDESEEEVGRTTKKVTTLKAPKGGGKKRASTMDAGQTPASKKARNAGGAGGSIGAGPSSGKKQLSAKKGKPEKEQNGAAPQHVTPAADAPSKKVKGNVAKANKEVSAKKDPEPPTKPKSPAKAESPGAGGEGGGESEKKRKRRRKSKGGAGPSSS
jgi:hypothetical protein